MGRKSHISAVSIAGSIVVSYWRNARDLTAEPPVIKHFSTDELRLFVDDDIKPKIGDF